MTITDLTDEETKDALARTQLSLVFLQFPVAEGSIVQAAHGDRESFVIVRHDSGVYFGWRLTDASKDERKAHYGGMLKRWQDSGKGTCFTPDGRETKL